MKFVGRTQETRHLRELIKHSQPKIAVIYGRRRVGKTSLLRNALQGESYLYFEGLEERGKPEQLRSFLIQLKAQTNIRIKTGISTWQEAFLILHEYLLENPQHIVLDEFQWMANYRKQIVSELKMVWDSYLSKIPGVTLLLCGSIASFMTTQVLQSSALYGRIDLEIHLKPFSLKETQLMLGNRGSHEILDAHLFTGGIPRYIELIAEAPSIRQAINDLAFTQNGYFTREYQRIFTSHFGRHPDYETFIRALASHPYGLNGPDLFRLTGIRSGGITTRRLKDLEAAGFIHSVTPLDRSLKSKQVRYLLSDAYLSFYFAFIEKNLKTIRAGTHDRLFFDLLGTGAMYQWQGRAFETLCSQHAKEIAEELQFAGIQYAHGPWFRTAKKATPGAQIDLLFQRKDHVVTLCEMKYQSSSVGISIEKEVERKMGILREHFPGYTIQPVLIVAGNVSRELGDRLFNKVINVLDWIE